MGTAVFHNNKPQPDNAKHQVSLFNVYLIFFHKNTIRQCTLFSTLVTNWRRRTIKITKLFVFWCELIGKSKIWLKWKVHVKP